MIAITIVFMACSTFRIPVVYAIRLIISKLTLESGLVDGKIEFNQKSIILDFSRPILLCLSLALITPEFTIAIAIFGCIYYAMLKYMLFRTGAFKNSAETRKHFLPSFFPWILKQGMTICFVNI